MITDKRIVSKKIRDSLIGMKLPEGLYFKEHSSWTFPDGHVFTPRNDENSEYLLMLYKGKYPVGMINYYTRQSSIILRMVQGVKKEGIPRITLKEPWVNTIMDSFLYSCIPYFKEGQRFGLATETTTYYKLLKEKLNSKRVDIDQFNKEIKKLILEKEHTKNEVRIDFIDSQINEFEKKINQINKSINTEFTQNKMYGSIRKRYLTNNWELALNKPKTKVLFLAHEKNNPKIEKMTRRRVLFNKLKNVLRSKPK